MPTADAFREVAALRGGSYVPRAEAIDPMVTLGSGDGTLFGPDGTALVIHAKADDYKSQPAGDAGDRVACEGQFGHLVVEMDRVRGQIEA